MLPDCSREGYTFDGWYTSGSGGSKIGNAGESYTPNATTTLYAQWKINSYTLIVNPNKGTWNGTTLNSSFTQNYGTTKSIANPTPPVGYTVTFDGNTGTAGQSSITSTKSFTNWTVEGPGTLTANYKNNEITLPTATKTGYICSGWYTKATGGEKRGDAGGKYTPSANETLYAHWTANTYTIVFDSNSGSGTMSNLIMTYDTPKNLTTNTFTKTGYEFLGWNTNKDATTAEYTDGEEVNNLTATNGGTVTLYAIWRKTITISYNANGGTGAPGSQTGTMYNSATTASITISSTKPTRTGYTFKGWATSPTSTTGTYQPGSTYSFSNSSVLYAVWQVNTYTLRLNAGTGSITNSSATYYDVSLDYGEDCNLDDYYSKVTKSNYVLIGWSNTSGGTIAYNIDSIVNNLSSTDGAIVNLYARYVTIRVRTWYSLSTDFDTISENPSALLDQQSGTGAQYKFLRNFNMQFISDDNKPLGKASNINYSGHFSGVGWQSTLTDGAVYGNDIRNNYYLQAIKAEITGYVAQYYDLYYCIHVRNIELLGWAAENQEAGTSNYYKPTEAIRVTLVREGNPKPTQVGKIPYSYLYATDPSRVAQGNSVNTVINTYRDSRDYAYKYIELGATGKSSLLYGLKLSLKITDDTSEHIQYRAHFSHTGWTDWSNGGILLNSQYRMQAVSIRLTSDLAQYFDIYYAAHVSHIGWMNWAKNGENAGTTGYGNDYPMESLRILLVKKGLTIEQLDLDDVYSNSNAFLQK